MSGRETLTLNWGKTKHPHRVIDAMMSSQWLIVPNALQMMYDIALREGEDLDALSGKLGRPLDNTHELRVVDSTAIIPITGPIFRYANLFTNISGATSLQAIVDDLREASEDPQIEKIALEIDSPGGQAAGIADLASLIQGIEKPVDAFVDHQAASAAMWIAAAADRIHISRAAMVGSIGVVSSIRRGADDRTIEIVSEQSPNKRPDVDTESGRAVFQRLANDLAQIFIEDVADMRDISVESILDIKGEMLVGQKAIDAGLADDMLDIDSFLAGVSGTTMRKSAMATAKSSPEITRDLIAAEHPAIADAFRKEGRDDIKSNHQELLESSVVQEAIEKARGEGAAAERDRIKAVQDQGRAMKGFDDLVNKMMFDGSTTGPEAAVQLISAHGAKMDKMRADVADEQPASVPPVQPSGDSDVPVDANLPVEKRAESEWDKSPDLRAEFPDLDTYVSFKRAEESGRVRRMGGKA